MNRSILKVGVLIIALIISLAPNYRLSINAAENEVVVVGQSFEFDEKNHYEFSGSYAGKDTNIANTVGTFQIMGDLAESGTHNSMTYYKVNDGLVSFFYKHNDSRATM